MSTTPPEPNEEQDLASRDGDSGPVPLSAEQPNDMDPEDLTAEDTPQSQRGNRAMKPEDVGALCERHGASILRRCLAILRDRAEAEDAAQEVYIVLLRKGGQFRGEAAITTWIYRLTTNVCLNRIRTNRRREGRESSDAVEAWVNVAPRDPYQHLAHRTEVQAVLESLDPLAQQIFVYRYIDGMSQEEIARATDRSRKTVGKRLQKLQALLESRLAASGETGSGGSGSGGSGSGGANK